MEARHSIFRYRGSEGEVKMAELKSILLAEDNPKDVELTLTALAENHLANEVVVARDGEEALDYLLRRAASSTGSKGTPPWSCST
jgi:hypothetical protein